MQTDSDKLRSYVTAIGWMMNVPVLLAFCFSILFYYLGVTFLAGIGVFAVSFVVNALVAKVSADYYEKYMKYQDERVSVTSECMNNIKTIKLYSWTRVF